MQNTATANSVHDLTIPRCMMALPATVNRMKDRHWLFLFCEGDSDPSSAVSTYRTPGKNRTRTSPCRCATRHCDREPINCMDRATYGRGAGVGRGRGVGEHLPWHGVAVGDTVGVGVNVPVAL